MKKVVYNRSQGCFIGEQITGSSGNKGVQLRLDPVKSAIAVGSRKMT
jgi:hypothetical protein